MSRGKRPPVRPRPQFVGPDPGPEEGGEDFAALFEESLQARRVEQGQTVEGVIVALTDEVAFVDVGGKGEATIDLSELKDDAGELENAVGDRITALVVSTEGGLKLSRRLARGAVAREQLGEAYRAGLPVEGKVERAIKGGYDVRIAGQRAFCPVSQIDTVFTSDPAVHEGKVYTFRITEFREGGKNLVVSRRALLEEEERERAEEVRASIVPGAVVSGRVASLQSYGAFIELGAGVQGLLHVSEISWSRLGHPSEALNPGDEVTVKVLRIDEAKKQIALGMKQLQGDPWATVARDFAVGDVRPGKVTRVAEFGAFVELAPGIEALAHAGTFPPTGKADGWKALVPPGTSGAFEVLSVDPAARRIGVAMLEEGSSRAEGALEAAKVEIAAGARLTGKVERIEPFGVFVFLAPGRTGLIPNAETGLDRGADLRRAFPVGSEVEVIVLEVEPGGRRIRLSRKAVADAEQRQDAQAYAARQAGDVQRVGGFGASLADKLKAAMERKK